MRNVLYIHGMGGGADSRIPAVLNGSLRDRGIDVIARTYSFDPEEASLQIASWVEELKPELIIGESLGAVHAIRIKDIPHLLISPALNAPLYFSWLSWLAVIPGMTAWLDGIYRPESGNRQFPHFTFDILRKYRTHRKCAVANTPLRGSGDYFHAFIGTRDHYRKTGVVSLGTWKKYFGETYTVYEGTHFTEEEYIMGLVVPKVLEMLDRDEVGQTVLPG